MIVQVNGGLICYACMGTKLYIKCNVHRHHTVEFFHVFLPWVKVESLRALVLVRNPVRVFR